ncbi:MAG: sialidase family protein [Chloroflexia bacterium]
MKSPQRSLLLMLLLPVLTLPALAQIATSKSAAPTSPPHAEFSPNLRVNQTTTDQQQEPTLAINPKDPQKMIVAAKDWREGRKEVWHYHSSDGGRTWADVHLPDLPTDLPNQSDPVVLYDADGVAFTSVIAYDKTDFSKGGMFVSRSTDNGATWSKPVQVTHNSANIFNDKEWLTVDRSKAASRGTLYMTWTLFTTVSPNQQRGDIVEVSSTDGGATWSKQAQISRQSDQNDVQGSYPAVGPDGSLTVLYYDQTSAVSLWAARSSDRGKTFADPVKVADVNRPPSPFPTSKFRMFVLPSLAVNPLDGTLVATWNDYPGNSDVLLTTSRDGNRTWSAPVRVNDDATANDQFFPSAVFGPDGVLHIAWLDRRDDPHNLTFSCYYTQSTDEGRSFAPDVRLADKQSDPSLGFDGILIGDYIQVDAVAGRANVAWVDTRDGDQNIYSAAVTGPLGPATGPAPQAVATPPASPPGDFIDPAFRRVWERTDLPVKDAAAADRAWTWGPAPFAAGSEPYQQGPNGLRLVQYFDKARMEINNPSADPAQKWYVTNGLLVVEMIAGRVQIGDNQFDDTNYRPNQVPVAGDDNSPDAPTYASLASVASLHGDNRAADLTGRQVTGILNRAGKVSPGTPPNVSANNVTAAHYDTVLGHNIPNVFWDFMNRQGPIYQDGKLTQGQVVDPLFDLGHPIAEAYWVRLRIGGQDKWALLQAFQRRVLTYVPDNADPFKVEMGNVGRHYYDWRNGSRTPSDDGE